jgi:hypothetical protein
MKIHWKPTFVGIGVQKSATTWCADALRLHPQVCMSQPKELNFFDNNFARGTEWYAQHFAKPELPIQGEISPLYMDHREVADRIAATFPNARILVILRNPFDRAMSNLLHEIRFTDGEVATASLEHMRLLARADSKFVRRSCYAEALRPYFERFPRSRIELLYYDDLQSDPLSFLRAVYRAVEANPDFATSSDVPAVNRTHDYVSPTLYRMLRRMSRLAKSWGPTRCGVEWLYRNTRLRERVLFHMTIDRGRPSFDFDDVFGASAASQIREDLHRLQDQLKVKVPPSWVSSWSGLSSRPAA